MISRLLLGGVLLLFVTRVAAGQPAVPGVVGGVVLDQTGGALPGASVGLVSGTGGVLRSTVTDATGLFHFEGLAAGTYEVRATRDGFKQGTLRVRAGARGADGLKIVLGLSDLTQEITVTNAGPDAVATTSNNRDAVAVDGEALEACQVDAIVLDVMVPELSGWAGS